MNRKTAVLFFACICLSSFSQTLPEKFKHLTVQNGLSHSWVKCFLEDKTGYLWVGTADGLNKYDGTSFKIYKYISSKPGNLNHNNINVLFEDSEGKLWVGTQAGLNFYDRKNDEFISLSAIINYVTCIFELENGDFLIGTAGGLFLFKPSNFTTIQLYNDIYIDKILKDQNNNFWLATSSGLMVMDTTDYSVFAILPNKNKKGSIKGTVIKSIFQDSKGGIWVGTGFQGLNYMYYPKNNPREAYFINYGSDPDDPSSISKGTIYSINEDDNQCLWIGIENGGINILDLNNFEPEGSVIFKHLSHNPFDVSSVGDNSIHSIYRDSQGTVWIGTYGGGVSFYSYLFQRFKHYSHLPGMANSINNNNVNVLYEEEKYLWVGTEGGLNRLNKENNKFDYFISDGKSNTSLSSNAVWSILRDSENNLWVGTWDGGLNLFNEKTQSFSHYYSDPNNPSSIGSNNIYQIIEDRDKNLWIALMGGGLNKLDMNTHKFKPYVEDFNLNSISSNWVTAILESRNGNIWISTTEAVDLLDKETGHFTSFTNDSIHTNSISYNGAISLYEDSRGNLWFGTSNGLNLFNKNDSTFTRFPITDGPLSMPVKAITEDYRGNLWFTTSSGIARFDQGIFVPQTPVFKTYTIRTELQGLEFKNRAVFRNTEGLIYFGSTYGYIVFNPDEIVENPEVPNIVFTDLLVYNKRVTVGENNSPLEADISVTKELKLTRKQSVFTIEFAALSFLAPENNQYAFFLEGFEKDWNYVGQQRNATYTNLDPGKYTFRVKASNNDGLWNEEGISLSIILLPAWWQTWVAKLFYAVFFVLGVYFFRKHTIISVTLKNTLWKEHLEKQKIEELGLLKQQFFANVSHELRTPLTLILGPLKKLISETGNSEVLRTIYRNATKLKTLVDQILDFSKIESNMMQLNFEQSDVYAFIQLRNTKFIEYAQQKNISLIINSNFNFCMADLDEDKFDKILTNLYSNAIKSIQGPGEVTTSLDIDEKEGMLKMDLSDTGKGIVPGEIEHIFERYYTSPYPGNTSEGTGIGLNLTRRLIELLKGTITVSSVPGKGSTFTINLPLRIHEIDTRPVSINFADQPMMHVESVIQESALEFHHEKTILVIDDNADICDFIESFLSDDFNVIKENNPLESVSHLISYLPDLIISDVMMPGMDGFELCRKIKNDVRFSHIPVILLTAKVTASDHIAGYETGADDYIYKPFEGEILKARVKNLITRKEKLRQHFIGSDGILNPKVASNDLDVVFIDEVLSLIRKNCIDSEFTVNTIIEKLGMSRSIFYKKFKALSDQSINDLIKNFRLKKAAGLIQEGSFSISQIAYECGFSDPAYFSRVFKEHYKVPPKDFTSNTTDAESPDQRHDSQ